MSRRPEARAPSAQVLYVAGDSSRPPLLRRDDVELQLVEARAGVVIDQVRSLPRLAVAWVDEEAGASGVPLVAALKTLEPDLPVIWSGRASAPAFQKPAPDALILGAAAWSGAGSQLAQLIKLPTYGVLHDALCNASVQSMAQGFNLTTHVAESFFKATRTPLASVCAAVEFGGRGVEASLIVSAEAKPLRDMLRLTVPGAVASLMALHDLAGEIANHIVGRLKGALDPDGVAFDRQSPLVLRGNEANLRSLRGRPSLVLRLSERPDAPRGDADGIFAQLYFKGAVPSRSQPPGGSPRPGELKFL